MSDNVKVVLAYPFTGPDGVEHRADSTVSLPREVAADLLFFGRARPAEEKTTAKKAATPKANSADSVKEK